MKNKLYLILIVLVALTSCRSWDRVTAMKINEVNFHPKLLTCEVKIHGDEQEKRAFADEERILFLGEIEGNISDPFGEKYGYIELFRTNQEARLGMVPWVFINGPLFQLPLLFGVPLAKPEIKISYEVRIYNANRRLLGKYEGHGEARSKIAAYHGYNSHDAFTMIYVESAKHAFAQIREKIQDDVLRLNSMLMSEGKL